MTTMNHMNHGGSMTPGGPTTMMNHGGMSHGSATPTMNHGGMDHGTTMMDHGAGHGGSGSGGHGMTHGMMMQMFFTSEWKGTVVLFEHCVLTEWWHLMFACIIVAIMAALYEGLKVARELLLIYYNQQMGEGSISSSNHVGPDAKDGIVTVVQPSHAGTIRGRMCAWIHWVQTFLHMVQVTVSYFLMLIFMTYQAYLCLSVVIGAGLGYLIFGWKRAVIIDANEHCH